jgi:hypothetical protein
VQSVTKSDLEDVSHGADDSQMKTKEFGTREMQIARNIKSLAVINVNDSIKVANE